jgi:hypothetical protein
LYYRQTVTLNNVMKTYIDMLNKTDCVSLSPFAASTKKTTSRMNNIAELSCEVSNRNNRRVNEISTKL